MDMDFHAEKAGYIEIKQNDGSLQDQSIIKIENGKESLFFKVPTKEHLASANKTENTRTGKTANFIFNNNYNENKIIPGNNMYEIVSNISQNDYLNTTVNDDNRCGAASLLNAYLIMGGKFENFSEKFNIDKALTYKNIHLVQEKLYNFANIDGKVGLISSFQYFFNDQGKITRAASMGEVVSAAGKLDMNIVPLIGSSVKSLNQKKDAIEGFLNNNPGSVLHVSVFLNTKTGEISGSKAPEKNHYILAFRKNGKYFTADTGQLFNDQGKNIRELSQSETEDLIFNNGGIISGLTLKNQNQDRNAEKSLQINRG
jgi:hypothetical protein